MASPSTFSAVVTPLTSGGSLSGGHLFVAGNAVLLPDSTSSSSSGSSQSSLSSASSQSSDSSSGSSPSSSEEAFIEQLTIQRASTIDDLDYGDDVIIQSKPFALEVDDLDPDATVTLFAAGWEIATGQITGSNEVTFEDVLLPLGRYDLTVVQQRDGLESVPSRPHSVRVNTEDNVEPVVAPPTIIPANVVSFGYPVTVRITSNIPGAQIFYTVDGTGYAQPTEPYVTVIEVSQTAVVKARVVYRGLKSKVARAVIRIVR